MTAFQKAAHVATFLLVGLVIFQILLVLGAPLGAAAWGGEHSILPVKLRIGSVLSIALCSVAVRVIRARAGLRRASPESRFARYRTWTFAVIFLLSALANLASSSQWERFLMAPLAIVLAGLYFVAAASHQV